RVELGAAGAPRARSGTFRGGPLGCAADDRGPASPARARMKVLVADVPLRSELGALPSGVELVAEPAADVEMVVLGLELMRRLPELFGELGGLRVVQSVFAGVDGFIASVPPGVVVCSASGAHDLAVSEWVVATLLAMRRRLPELLDRQRHGEWDANVNESTATGASALGAIDDLDGSMILVLGYGSIRRAGAARP